MSAQLPSRERGNVGVWATETVNARHPGAAQHRGREGFLCHSLQSVLKRSEWHCLCTGDAKLFLNESTELNTACCELPDLMLQWKWGRFHHTQELQPGVDCLSHCRQPSWVCGGREKCAESTSRPLIKMFLQICCQSHSHSFRRAHHQGFPLWHTVLLTCCLGTSEYFSAL